jgi:hypothetical protein
MSKLETTLVGICNAEHSETSPGKFEGTETLTKHVYFVNDLSVELAKKAFIVRFLKRIPLSQLEKLVNFKMEDMEIEGQYPEASKFSAELIINAPCEHLYVIKHSDSGDMSLSECQNCGFRP